jgi:hypothetical protein
MNYSNIIPLGDNCAISIILKELNLRSKSYPFDWCSHVGPSPIYSNIEINIKILLELLESGNYEETAYSLLNKKISSDEKINGELIFPHETGNISEVNAKYLRRIERLYVDITNKKNKNLFILLTRGYYVSENIITNLYNSLMKYNNNNHIIFISGIEHSYLPNMNMKNLIFKYIYYDISKGWEYDYTDFRPKLKQYLLQIKNNINEI